MSAPCILMVEDDELDRFILRRALLKRWPRARLIEAGDGLDAIAVLNALEGTPPDLIMLDINMPRMGGLEFLEAYYADGGHAVPIVMMLTSSNREDDRHAAGRYPCVREYLIKPIDRSTVAALPDPLDRAA